MKKLQNWQGSERGSFNFFSFILLIYDGLFTTSYSNILEFEALEGQSVPNNIWVSHN